MNLGCGYVADIRRVAGYQRGTREDEWSAKFDPIALHDTTTAMFNECRGAKYVMVLWNKTIPDASVAAPLPDHMHHPQACFPPECLNMRFV